MRHHGRGLFRITKNRELVDAITKDFRTADIPDGDAHMLEYVEKLTKNACSMAQGDLDGLKKAGFEDADILDIAQVCAYYNFVNRLACGLGVELEEE